MDIFHNVMKMLGGSSSSSRRTLDDNSYRGNNNPGSRNGGNVYNSSTTAFAERFRPVGLASTSTSDGQARHGAVVTSALWAIARTPALVDAIERAETSFGGEKQLATVLQALQQSAILRDTSALREAVQDANAYLSASNVSFFDGMEPMDIIRSIVSLCGDSDKVFEEALETTYQTRLKCTWDSCAHEENLSEKEESLRCNRAKAQAAIEVRATSSNSGICGNCGQRTLTKRTVMQVPPPCFAATWPSVASVCPQQDTLTVRLSTEKEIKFKLSVVVASHDGKIVSMFRDGDSYYRVEGNFPKEVPTSEWLNVKPRLALFTRHTPFSRHTENDRIERLVFPPEGGYGRPGNGRRSIEAVDSNHGRPIAVAEAAEVIEVNDDDSSNDEGLVPSYIAAAADRLKASSSNGRSDHGRFDSVGDGTGSHDARDTRRPTAIGGTGRSSATVEMFAEIANAEDRRRFSGQKARGRTGASKAVGVERDVGITGVSAERRDRHEVRIEGEKLPTSDSAPHGNDENGLGSMSFLEGSVEGALTRYRKGGDIFPRRDRARDGPRYPASRAINEPSFGPWIRRGGGWGSSGAEDNATLARHREVQSDALSKRGFHPMADQEALRCEDLTTVESDVDVNGDEEVQLVTKQTDEEDRDRNDGGGKGGGGLLSATVGRKGAVDEGRGVDFSASSVNDKTGSPRETRDVDDRVSSVDVDTFDLAPVHSTATVAAIAAAPSPSFDGEYLPGQHFCEPSPAAPESKSTSASGADETIGAADNIAAAIVSAIDAGTDSMLSQSSLHSSSFFPNARGEGSWLRQSPSDKRREPQLNARQVYDIDDMETETATPLSAERKTEMKVVDKPFIGPARPPMGFARTMLRLLPKHLSQPQSVGQVKRAGEKSRNSRKRGRSSDNVWSGGGSVGRRSPWGTTPLPRNAPDWGDISGAIGAKATAREVGEGVDRPDAEDESGSSGKRRLGEDAGEGGVDTVTEDLTGADGSLQSIAGAEDSGRSGSGSTSGVGGGDVSGGPWMSRLRGRPVDETTLTTIRGINLQQDHFDRIVNSDGWLTSQIIDIRVKQLQEKYPEHLYFDSSFFGFLCPTTEKNGSFKVDYERVQGWTKSSRLPAAKSSIFEMRKLFIPINQGNVHWVLVVVDLGETDWSVEAGSSDVGGSDKGDGGRGEQGENSAVASFFDSFGRDGTPYVEAIQQYLISELTGRGSERQGHFATEPRPPENAPRQHNSSDCGVLMLHAMEVLSTQTVTGLTRLSQEEIMSLRWQLVADVRE